MYHMIVRRRIQTLFDAVNRGDAEPVLASFSNTFEHIFLGQHALGGRRTSLLKTRAWYARLFRLLPDLHFDIRDIQVAGGPWNTLVMVAWLETNSGTDGKRTYNQGIHAVRLRWGKMTQLTICPDTVALIKTLDRLAAAGVAEAAAKPIT